MRFSNPWCIEGNNMIDLACQFHRPLPFCPILWSAVEEEQALLSCLDLYIFLDPGVRIAALRALFRGFVSGRRKAAILQEDAVKA